MAKRAKREPWKEWAFQHYHVKFVWKGETRYGVVDQYGDEEESALKCGQCIVSDSETPQRYRLKQTTLVGFHP